MNNSQKILDILLQSIQKKNTTEKKCLLDCGINTSFLTDWKGGRLKNPAYDKIVKLAEYLEIDLNYLFTGIDCTSKTTTIELPQPKLSKNEEEMLEMLNQLSERDQVRLLGRVEGIVKEYVAKYNVEENVG